MNTILEEELVQEIVKNIPSKLHRILIVRNYSEKGLGYELGVTQKTINRWKRGERKCTLPEAALRIHLLARNL